VRGHIFAEAFLWLKRQSSSFNDTFRVKKVKLSICFLLFTCRVICGKKFSVMRNLIKKKIQRDA